MRISYISNKVRTTLLCTMIAIPSVAPLATFADRTPSAEERFYASRFSTITELEIAAVGTELSPPIESAREALWFAFLRLPQIRRDFEALITRGNNNWKVTVSRASGPQSNKWSIQLLSEADMYPQLECEIALSLTGELLRDAKDKSFCGGKK